MLGTKMTARQRCYAAEPRTAIIPEEGGWSLAADVIVQAREAGGEAVDHGHNAQQVEGWRRNLRDGDARSSRTGLTPFIVDSDSIRSATWRLLPRARMPGSYDSTTTFFSGHRAGHFTIKAG